MPLLRATTLGFLPTAEPTRKLSKLVKGRPVSPCSPATETKSEIEVSVLDSDSSSIRRLVVILQATRTYLERTTACDAKLVFGYYQGATVGIYTGSAVENRSIAPSIIQKLLDEVSCSPNMSAGGMKNS